MNLASLAAKQKRIKDWSSFFDSEVSDTELKREFGRVLTTYRHMLLKLWETQGINPTDEKQILDLERRLEGFMEEARLLAVRR